jgi:hypothetical protein
MDKEITLSPEQVSQALMCLYNNRKPEGALRSLSLMDWEVLHSLLEQLLWEKAHSPLH